MLSHSCNFASCLQPAVKACKCQGPDILFCVDHVGTHIRVPGEHYFIDVFQSVTDEQRQLSLEALKSLERAREESTKQIMQDPQLKSLRRTLKNTDARSKARQLSPVSRLQLVQKYQQTLNQLSQEVSAKQEDLKVKLAALSDQFVSRKKELKFVLEFHWDQIAFSAPVFEGKTPGNWLADRIKDPVLNTQFLIQQNLSASLRQAGEYSYQGRSDEAVKFFKKKNCKSTAASYQKRTAKDAEFTDTYTTHTHIYVHTYTHIHKHTH